MLSTETETVHGRVATQRRLTLIRAIVVLLVGLHVALGVESSLAANLGRLVGASITWYVIYRFVLLPLVASKVSADTEDQ